MTEALPREPQDHPIVKAWINGAHRYGAGGSVSFRIACVIITKGGKKYGMPLPPPYVRPHLEEAGEIVYGAGDPIPAFSSL